MTSARISLHCILKWVWKMLFSFFRKCYGLLGYDLAFARCQNPWKHRISVLLLFLLFFIDSAVFYISTSISHEPRLLKPINRAIFWKNSKRFSTNAEINCSNCDWNFAVISRKYKKWAIFDILMAITLGVNMTTRQMTPFFSSIFQFYQLVCFIFAFKDLQNSIPWGPIFALCSGL